MTTSRVLTVTVMALSGAVTFVLEDVLRAWEIALESGAGIGLVLIMRWYWWRVTAISEIAALVAAAAGFIGITFFTDIVFPVTLLYLVPWTTACWLAATWLCPAEPMAHLVRFYTRVRPSGIGWSAVARHAGIRSPDPSVVRTLPDWVAGCGLVYGTLFATGTFLFGSVAQAVGWGVMAVVAACWLWRALRRYDWQQDTAAISLGDNRGG